MLEIFKTLPEEIFNCDETTIKEIKTYKLGGNPTEVIVALLRNPIAISEDKLEKIFDTIFNKLHKSMAGKIYCMQKSSLALTINRDLPLVVEGIGEHYYSESIAQYKKENYFINYFVRKIDFSDPSNYDRIIYDAKEGDGVRDYYNGDTTKCSPMVRVVDAIKASRDLELVKLFTHNAILTIVDKTTPDPIKAVLLKILTENFLQPNRETELYSYTEHGINPDFVRISRDHICVGLVHLFDDTDNNQKSLEYAFFIQDPKVKIENSKGLFTMLVKFFRPDYQFTQLEQDALFFTDAYSDNSQKMMNAILPGVTAWFFKKTYRDLKEIRETIKNLYERFCCKPVANPADSVLEDDSQQEPVANSTGLLTLFDGYKQHQQQGNGRERDIQEYQDDVNPERKTPDLRKQHRLIY